MLILNDGYTLLRYDSAANTVTVTELARSANAGASRTTMTLPDFLNAITPVPTDDDE